MNSIEKVVDSNNIKNLNSSNCKQTCDTLRHFLIKNVLNTGGHLASNLGVVELTLAIHKCFDLPIDKVVFDVGHQSYVHKILSGRYNKFDSLRKFGGISGFPKTSESEFDSFNTGHSSTSISAALGIARARDLKGEKYNVVALIGDGALGGGMAFEALDDAGSNKTKLIIILNDNEMSINRNVGGLSAHLSMLRTGKKYLNAKNKLHRLLDKTGSVGKGITSAIKSAKQAVKFATIAKPMFEEIGIKYIGIIDGHDIDELTEAFEKAKNIDGPVIIHTFTIKGKGYKPAEDTPDIYHGVSPKKTHNQDVTKSKTYTEIFGDYILKKAEENKKIVAITAAMGSGCGLANFSHKFPDRFFDVGIAEQHATTLAAGLASAGILPVFCVYSTFLQRSYDQILHDVCMQNLHVVFAIDRAGIVGEDGETHQGIFDMSYLLHIPNMTVLSPSCEEDFIQMLDYAIDECTGPVAIRYPRAMASKRDNSKFNSDSFEIVEDSGNDVVLLSVGRMLDKCETVYQKLIQNNIGAKLINVGKIKPLNKIEINKIVDNCKLVVTVEDGIIFGGAGKFLASGASRKNQSKFICLGFDDCFVCQGTQEELFDEYKLDADSIYDTIIKELKSYE